MTNEVSDADAYIALLAWERCSALAARAKDPLLRRCWENDADAAWQLVERWKAGQAGRADDHPERLL